MIWDDATTGRMGELIDAGWTMTQAAEAMGVTKNAIAGRTRRMGWRFGVPRPLDQRYPPFITTQGARSPSYPRPVRKGEQPVYVNTGFDPETFAEIEARAKADGVTRAQIVRELVEWGLEA